MASRKMIQFLHQSREKAREADRLFDWAWTGSCWKPVKNYRVISRGKKVGWVLVVLYDPPGKRLKVRKNDIRYKERTIQ